MNHSSATDASQTGDREPSGCTNAGANDGEELPSQLAVDALERQVRVRDPLGDKPLEVLVASRANRAERRDHDRAELEARCRARVLVHVVLGGGAIVAPHGNASEEEGDFVGGG